MCENCKGLELNLTRRHTMVALGAGLLGPFIATGLTKPAVAADQTGPKGSPREILIRGGYVMPVDPVMADLIAGDVHIKDGEIVAVAAQINAPNAEIIDASNMVVLPGFVDTHWHMWNSIWRGMVNDATEYFTRHDLLPYYSVEDHHTAVQYAALEGINAGITTCHNWAHGLRNYDDVQAELSALAEVGIRAKLSYSGVIRNVPTPSADLQRALDWIAANGNGRLGLGMTLDGAGEHFAPQVQVARKLGLRPITDHGSFMAFPDLIGPEFIFTHGAGIAPEAVTMIARKKLGIALCPGTDPMIGNGLPPVYDLIKGGVPLDNISFSIDVSCQSPVDPFASLRTLVNSGRIQQVEANKLTGDLIGIAQKGLKWVFSYRDAIRVGTLSGAHVLGLSDHVGSLTPGKRADVILVRTDQANMLPAANTNPAFQIVQHADPVNVDTVIIDGVIRKRNGKLTGVDIDGVVEKAARAQEAIRKRANLPVLDTSL
ncbi:cytosine/adenosine deaminase-related metal-dependent hydrolase [Rhizobium sp. BK275]|uniref:amidohydrolase family protein n=1 Tax=Rhizobium sp. BK275 TaxID=2587077 RepID=UPI0016168484|nr:amidohydrolase family protein [Rhizobium sp. BK275]MBB3388221.1 cytosine/adenosine deaminase-related metal-dependent hydrolase [Rhizobium sp. BK275]